MTDTDRTQLTPYGLDNDGTPVLVETVRVDDAAADGPADACDASTTPAHTSTYKTLNGSTIAVSAWRGTQAIGRISGDPIDVTIFGRVTVTVTDPSGAVAVLDLTDDNDAEAVCGLIRRGSRVADTRDVTDDTYLNF